MSNLVDLSGPTVAEGELRRAHSEPPDPKKYTDDMIGQALKVNMDSLSHIERASRAAKKGKGPGAGARRRRLREIKKAAETLAYYGAERGDQRNKAAEAIHNAKDPIKQIKLIKPIPGGSRRRTRRNLKKKRKRKSRHTRKQRRKTKRKRKRALKRKSRRK